MNTQVPLTVLVDAGADAIEAHIRDHRADALAVFTPLTEAQRTGLVTDAWTIGLRALMNAYKQAEEARLQDIGKTLKEDLDRQLQVYVERQQATFVQVLARYFDPRDGQVVARLEGFLRDGGDLAKTMERYLSPERGELALTLARELGENSPLLKRLSPTDSEGVLFLLEAKLREVLAENHAEVTRALDPVAEDGAVARFLRALRQELEKADNDRSKQLAVATKALDANDENSLLSRLMRETAAAKNAFIMAMNPELPTSPMGVLKNTLSTLLEQHVKTQEESMLALHERQAKFEQNVREALVRLEERKRGDMKSPRGGTSYEEAVLRFVQHAVQGAPLEVSTTANTVGAKPNCKKGDQVLRFTAEADGWQRRRAQARGRCAAVRRGRGGVVPRRRFSPRDVHEPPHFFSQRGESHRRRSRAGDLVPRAATRPGPVSGSAPARTSRRRSSSWAAATHSSCSKTATWT
jgi:hypothetical protein